MNNTENKAMQKTVIDLFVESLPNKYKIPIKTYVDNYEKAEMENKADHHRNTIVASHLVQEQLLSSANKKIEDANKEIIELKTELKNEKEERAIEKINSEKEKKKDKMWMYIGIGIGILGLIIGLLPLFI